MKRASKLVRDEIPNLLTPEMQAKNPTFHQGSDRELRKYFLDKIIEEATELRNAYDAENDSFDHRKVSEEYADMILAQSYARDFFGIHDISIREAATDKSLRNGVFDKGTIMEYDSE